MPSISDGATRLLGFNTSRMSPTSSPRSVTATRMSIKRNSPIHVHTRKCRTKGTWVYTRTVGSLQGKLPTNGRKYIPDESN